MFVKIKGRLFWRDVRGNLIGPLDASTPTCSEGNGSEPNY